MYFTLFSFILASITLTCWGFSFILWSAPHNMGHKPSQVFCMVGTFRKIHLMIFFWCCPFAVLGCIYPQSYDDTCQAQAHLLYGRMKRLPARWMQPKPQCMAVSMEPNCSVEASHSPRPGAQGWGRICTTRLRWVWEIPQTTDVHVANPFPGVCIQEKCVLRASCWCSSVTSLRVTLEALVPPHIDACSASFPWCFYSWDQSQVARGVGSPTHQH